MKNRTRMNTNYSTLCLKKVPTFKLAVTLSNLNRFSKVLHCWKESVWNLLQNIYNITRFTLGMLLHYLGKLNIQIFCIYSAIIPDMEENANKLHFKCADFNSSARVTVYDVCIYVFLSQSCPRRWISCWSLTNTAVTSAVMNFRCHKLIARVTK